jgi:hypothetical protein
MPTTQTRFPGAFTVVTPRDIGAPRCHSEHPKHSSGVANQAQHPFQLDNNLAIIYIQIHHPNRAGELKLAGYFNLLKHPNKHTNKQTNNSSRDLMHYQG